jgi:hypothetical protein
MSRLFAIAVATLVLIACQAISPARVLACDGDDCFPGHFWPQFHYRGVHRFQPKLHDGVPIVRDYPDYYGAYYGTACIWTQRTVPTENGPAVALVPHCASYGALD